MSIVFDINPIQDEFIVNHDLIMVSQGGVICFISVMPIKVYGQH